MSTNLFSKCPKCGESIKSNAISCTKCNFQITSSFGSEKDFYSKLFLDLAAKNNILSENDTEIIYEEYKSLLNTEYPMAIEQLLLNKKVINQQQTLKLIAGTLRIIDKEFCKKAFQKNWLTQEEAITALEIQKKLYKEGILKSVADIFKEKKILTDEQINEVLKTHSLGQTEKKDTGYKPLTQMWQEEDKKKVQNTIRNKLDQKSQKIGRLAVKHQFISQEDFDQSVSQWSQLPPQNEISFLDFLEEKGFLDRKKTIILTIHYEYETIKEIDIMFLKLAIVYKFIKEADASKILKDQNSIFQNQHKIIPVCDIIHEKKLMTNIQIKRILMEQQRTELAKKFLSDTQPEETSNPDSAKKIKPIPESETVNDIKIEISPDSMRAMLHPLSAKVKIEAVKSKLNENGIVYGIVNDDVITSLIEEGFDSPIAIANGRPPVLPVNAEIKCLFSENYLNVGHIDEEGNIDFMDRGEIPVAEEGQFLAEKIPPIPGKDGIDIFGNEILVEEPNDISLTPGEGTRTDESGDKIYAAQKGQPHISIDGRVSVFNIHEIKGDVDFHTGHIEFDGNIIIHGNIKPGFRVTGNNITAESATDAILNAKGHIEIKNGLAGGKVFAQQGLSAKFINQTDITACGNVNIEKEILESKIKTSGIVTVKSGKIISSHVSAKGGVDSKQIGTDVSTPSTIEIGTDSYLERILSPYIENLENTDKQIEEIKAKIESIAEKDKQTHIEIAQKAQVQDKANQALAKLKEHYELVSMSGRTSAGDEIKSKINELNHKVQEYEKIMDSLFESQDEYQKLSSEYSLKIKELNEKKEEITLQIESVNNYNNSIPPSPVLIVQGTIEKGTKVIAPNSIWKVHETTKNIKAHEIKTKDQDGNSFHIIKVDKNK